ncbi:MAG: TonB-dependent siderophore receptor [Xanthomonadaceae bacterium]|nr:TonB-dependent siderophore receptor [Xanthomonadaceae bacterium]
MLAAAAISGSAFAEAGGGGAHTTDLDTMYVTAAQIARQALGASVITVEDIERRPPANDLSDLLRTMPGVNLTGNSASGQYGNNRQIDLRGMGPENTLILIDGKPVGSRDSVRMGRSGERNTRGDTNWVPVEAVERIEVLRGPAAARYGSGASGGVVNIITKKPGDEFSGSLNMFAQVPQHSEEGQSQRIGFQMSGPVSGDWAFRLYGNVNKTDADSLDLNARYADGVTPPAGREGVRNRDINGLLRWDPTENQTVEFEAGFSRQGNIYAGDRAVSSAGADLLTELANEGAETNVMIRRSASITHRGKWDFGTSRFTLAYENTDNTRLKEGLAGGVEGSIAGAGAMITSDLKNYTAEGDLNVPFALWGLEQVATVGFEYRDSRLDDPYSMSQTGANGGGIPGLESDGRSGKSDMQETGVFVEDNISIGDRWVLTPGLRFDHNSQFGNNWSPSLNAQFHISESVSLKGGIARAFKAPNLYQSNPNYLYYTRGNGCPTAFPSLGAGCYVQGNANLDPETSINKEIGIEWAADSGYHATLTYFHNDYKNKIVSGLDRVGWTSNTQGQVFQWTNASKAVVQGFEGSLKIPLMGSRGDVLSWNTNATYMIDNKNKDTGQPLSIIPKYTINTFLDWRPSEAWSVLLTGTFYGKQKPASEQATTGATLTGDYLRERGAYQTWSLSTLYRITPRISVGGGVSNLFDKRLFREANSNGAGAATYNEPGRAYYVTMSIGF